MLSVGLRLLAAWAQLCVRGVCPGAQNAFALEAVRLLVCDLTPHSDDHRGDLSVVLSFCDLRCGGWLDHHGDYRIDMGVRRGGDTLGASDRCMQSRGHGGVTNAYSRLAGLDNAGCSDSVGRDNAGCGSGGRDGCAGNDAGGGVPSSD